MRWPTRRVSGRWVVVAGAVSAGWLIGSALPPAHAGRVQAEPPAAGDAGAVSGTNDGERGEMKERLARRIAELESRSQMLKSAMQRLERGESLDSVREFVRDRGTIVGRLLADHEAAGELDRLEGRQPVREGAGRARVERGPGRGPDGGAEGVSAWRDRAEHGGPLTKEEREVIRDMLLATEPGALPMLEGLPADRAGEADKKMRRLLPVAGAMIELRRRDPTLYRLRLEQMRWEREVFLVVRKIVDLEPAAAEHTAALQQLRLDLRAAGGRAFDMRIAVQAHELGKLQARLDTVRKDIDEQESQREELITLHVERMLEGARQRRSDDLHGGPRHDMERDMERGQQHPPRPMEEGDAERPRRRPPPRGGEGPRR